MKVQVHHNEVSPLVKEGYEKVFDAMKKLLAPEEFIFAEWKAGFGDMLQWSLPNDRQWLPLAQADSFDREAVITEFIRMRDTGAAKLGKNKTLINNVYSVPAESFVYYSITPEGKYSIMLTGWGYTYPRQMPMVPIVGSVDPAAQAVKIQFKSHGNPMPLIQFEVPRSGNRLIHLQADANGECSLGSLMPGSTVEINIPSLNEKRGIEIIKGKEFYTIDLTPKPAEIIPEIITPAHPPKKKNDEITEEIIARNRDIAIRFIGCDSKPLTSAEAEFCQSGRPTIAEGIDNDGIVYLDKNDFLCNSPLTVMIKGNENYPTVTLALEPNETQYEIIFHEKKKSSFWLQAICWLGAVVLALAAVCAACEISHHV